jgi:hypothetical protein
MAAASEAVVSMGVGADTGDLHSTDFPRKVKACSARHQGSLDSAKA